MRAGLDSDTSKQVAQELTAIMRGYFRLGLVIGILTPIMALFYLGKVSIFFFAMPVCALVGYTYSLLSISVLFIARRYVLIKRIDNEVLLQCKVGIVLFLIPIVLAMFLLPLTLVLPILLVLLLSCAVVIVVGATYKISFRRDIELLLKLNLAIIFSILSIVSLATFVFLESQSTSAQESLAVSMILMVSGVLGGIASIVYNIIQMIRTAQRKRAVAFFYLGLAMILILCEVLCFCATGMS